MALQKIVDSMRDVTVVDGAKITTGAVPSAALSNVDLVEGTKGADIASTGTMVIGTDGGYFDITGTTGITAMTVAAGRMFTLQFDGAVVLTNSSTLKLSGAANFTTAAGDHLTFVSVAANDVRQTGFGLTDGGSPITPAGGVAGITTSANATAISISADEEVTMPLQPCFNVKMAANAANVTGNGTSYVVGWDTEILDIGSNFDTSTYKFTAPVAGKYLLTFQAAFANNVSYNADYWSSNIHTSNRNYSNWALDVDITWRDWMANMVVVADMDAADEAWCSVGVTGVGADGMRVDGATGSNFTGCLLA